MDDSLRYTLRGRGRLVDEYEREYTFPTSHGPTWVQRPEGDQTRKIERLMAYQQDKKALSATLPRPGQSVLPEHKPPPFKSNAMTPLTISYRSDRTGRELVSAKPEAPGKVLRRARETLRLGATVSYFDEPTAGTKRATGGGIPTPITADVRARARRRRRMRETGVRSGFGTSTRRSAAASARQRRKSQQEPTGRRGGAGQASARAPSTARPTTAPVSAPPGALDKVKPPYGRRTWRKGDAVPKGLIDGIVRVTIERLEAATSVCETYSTVKYTDFDKNMASISVIVRPIGYELFIEQLDFATEHDFQFLAALPTQPAPTPEHPGPYAAVKHVKNQEELDEERRLELAEEKAQRRIMERERMHGRKWATEQTFEAADRGQAPKLQSLLIVGLEAGGIRHTPDIDWQRESDGMTALCAAAFHGHDSCVRILLNHGADRTKRTLKGLQALDLARNAREHWRERMMAGAANATKRHKGAAESYAALEDRTLMRSAKDNDLRRLRYLVLQQGQDCTHPNQYGMTALHFAVMNRNLKMILFLIERGADPTFSNNVYQSPLDLAESMSDNRVIVQALKRAPKLVAERRKRRDSIERAFKEEKERELAIEMRQFTRGTSNADTVFSKYNPNEANQRRLAAMRGQSLDDSSAGARSGAGGRAGAGSGQTRFMLTKSKGHHSSTGIAKSVRFDGSLTQPRLSDDMTSSRARHARRLGGAGAAVAGVGSGAGAGGTGRRPGRSSLRSKHSASADVLGRLPKPTHPKFDQFAKTMFGAVA